MTVTKAVKLRIRPHQGQRDTIESESPIVAAIAGTGGGKTVSGYIWLLLAMAKNPGATWIVAEPTERMVNRILLTAAPGRPSLPQFFAKFDPKQQWSKTEGILRHKLGQIVICGMDNPDAAQGVHASGIWLDEAGLMPYLALLTARQRVSFEKGQLLITTTPYDMGWLRTEIYERREDPDITVIKYPSTANPAYPKEQMEAARRTFSKERFAMMYEGDFARPEGMIYDVFDEEHHLVDEPRILNPGQPVEYIGGIDFGWNHPTAACVVANDPESERAVIIAEHRQPSSTIAEHAEALQAMAPTEDMVWYADPSAPQLIAELREYGLNITEADNDVTAGIGSVYAALKDDRLRIYRGLTHTRSEIASYAWKRDRNSATFTDEPVKRNDDLMDAARYAIHSPRTKPALRLAI